jgi:hypothetical protein
MATMSEPPERPDRDEPVLPPERPRLPVVSIVGLVALALSLVFFSVSQYQNIRTLRRVEQLQAQQQEFSRARAPATRAALCNLEIALTTFAPPPTEPTRLRAYKILKQNIEALDCPRAIMELPVDVPTNPP